MGSNPTDTAIRHPGSSLVRHLGLLWGPCVRRLRGLIDRAGGSWHHELAPDHSAAAAVWPGRADLCHAFQATLIARQPLTPAMASAVAAGLLR